MTLKKLKTIVVEDQLDTLKNLKQMLERLPAVELVASFSSYEQCKNKISTINFDLLISDIKIDDEATIFDVLDCIVYKDFMCIFITAYDEFAIKAIKYSAIDYLIKPINIEDLSLAIDKALNEINIRMKANQINLLLNNIKTRSISTKMFIPSIQQYSLIDIDDILYIESDANYSIFHFFDLSSILSTCSIKHYESSLPTNQFFRSHQSYIANMKYVKNISMKDANLLVFTNGKTIPFSIRHKDKLKKYLQENYIK